MHRNQNSWSVTLHAATAVLVIAMTGCGSAKPVPAPTSTTSEANAVALDSATSTAKLPAAKPLVATASEGTAAATFEQTLVAFQQGRLDTAFDFLPPSFQADINDIVHEFADKMDAELWSKSFATVAKLGQLLKAKKASFQNLDMLKQAAQFKSIEPHWDGIATVITDVATSEVANLSQLKQSDVRRMLVSASHLTTGMPLPSFGDVQVSAMNVNDDSTTLSYRESTNSPPNDVEFVRIEGKWLPKTIATGWAGWMAEARKNLSELPDRVSAVKPQLLTKLDTIDGMLDQVKGTKTQEEFSQAILPLFFTIMLEGQMAQQSLRDASIGTRKGNAVHCNINRELTETEQTQLKDAIITATGNSNVDYEMIPNEGKTRCRFTPIHDIDAVVVAVTAHFEGATVHFDNATKSIEVELK